MSTKPHSTIYDALCAVLTENDPLYPSLISTLNGALRIVAEQRPPGDAAADFPADSKQLNEQLLTAIARASQLPFEYPTDIANCVELVRHGTQIDDISAVELTHRTCLDNICRCGLTCHLMALMTDGHITVEQLFKTRYSHESPFLNAVISNDTLTVLAIIEFCTHSSAGGEGYSLLIKALRTKGTDGRVPLHYCAKNRNALMFSSFLSPCPDTLTYFDQNGCTPADCMITSWTDGVSALEKALKPEKHGLPSNKLDVLLMTASPQHISKLYNDNNVKENGNCVKSSILASPVSPVHKVGSSGVRSADAVLVDRQYDSCLRRDLETGRNLIYRAARNGTAKMLRLLTDVFVAVAKTDVFPNRVYFQHFLHNEPLEAEPILAAYSSGAETNFLQLLLHAAPDLFVECTQIQRSAYSLASYGAGCVRTEENSKLSLAQLVRKYFLVSGNTSLSSPYPMRALVSSIVGRPVVSNSGSDKESDADMPLDAITLFAKAQSRIETLLDSDIAAKAERCILIFDVRDNDCLRIVQKIRSSFEYARQMRTSRRAAEKLSDRNAKTIFMPKLRCNCELSGNPCSMLLETIHPNSPPLTKSCPCSGNFSQCNTDETVAEVSELASTTMFFPNIDTFPKMAGYYWQKRAEITETDPLIYDLRIVPRMDDGTSMAFLYACCDECRCDESTCPTATLFNLSRCFFEIRDFGQPRLGLQRYGLCAREIIADGQYIGEVIGELCTRQDVNEMADFDLEDDNSVYQWQNVKQVPLPVGKLLLSEVREQVKEFEFYVNQSRVGNFTRFIRHACGSNANVSVHLMLPRGITDMRQRIMVLFANRHIAAGEELTMDFGDWFFYRTHPWAVCGCGPRCRRLEVKHE